MADLHVPIRAGTDIAFLGGLIRHVLETESLLPRVRPALHERGDARQRALPGHRGPRRRVLRLRPRDRHLRPARPGCTRAARSPSAAGQREHATQAFEEHDRRRDADRRRPSATRRCSTRAASSRSLQPPLRALHAGDGRAHLRHLAGGLPRGRRRADRATPAASARPRSCYAVGWTQHTAGVQMIRAGGDPAAAAGNIGPPGRRHPGAARPRLDPGLDRHPDALRPAARLPAHAARARGGADARATTSTSGGADRGWWSHFDKYIVSLLKAWFGDAATRGERLRLRAPCRRSPATTRTSRRCCARSTAASTGCS